jgi:hypothetical protein
MSSSHPTPPPPSPTLAPVSRYGLSREQVTSLGVLAHPPASDYVMTHEWTNVLHALQRIMPRVCGGGWDQRRTCFVVIANNADSDADVPTGDWVAELVRRVERVIERAPAIRCFTATDPLPMPVTLGVITSPLPQGVVEEVKEEEVEEAGLGEYEMLGAEELKRVFAFIHENDLEDRPFVDTLNAYRRLHGK